MPEYDWEPETVEFVSEFFGKKIERRKPQNTQGGDGKESQQPAAELRVKVEIDNVLVTSFIAGFGFTLGAFLASLLLWMLGGAAILSAIVKVLHR